MALKRERMWKHIDQQDAVSDVQALIADMEALLQANNCTEGELRTRTEGAMLYSNFAMRDAAGNVYTYVKAGNQMTMQIDPRGLTLYVNQEQQFTATVTDENSQPVDNSTGTNWIVECDDPQALFGSIDVGTGLYMAPNTIPAPVAVRVRARYTAPDSTYVESEIPLNLQPTLGGA